MKVAIAGSTGLIGEALVRALEAHGHLPVRLVRGDKGASGDAIFWDPNQGLLPQASLADVEAVVCLSGESIGGRWSDRKKRTILESRVRSAGLISQTMASMLRDGPNVLICASAIGLYGDRGDEVLDEGSGRGTGFLAEVCEAWEAAIAPANSAGIRTVSLRLGVVLDPGGGMLKQITPVFRAGLGGVIGNGDQYMSWVSLEDTVRAIEYCLSHDLNGAVNVTAPNPVTNREFTKTLGRVLRRPTFFGVPALAVKTVLGEAGESLALSSARVVPAKLETHGFAFAKPVLEPALREMFSRV